MGHSPLGPEGKIRLWLLALLLVSIFQHARDLWTPGLLDRSGRPKGADYMRLYATGALAREGRWRDLYDASAHVAVAKARIDPRIEMAGLHPNYGPTAALALAPLTGIHFLPSWALLVLVSTVVFLIGCYAVAGRCLHIAAHAGTAVLAAAASPALFEAIRYGQLSAVTATCVAGGAILASRQRPLAAGFVVGLAFYKPNLVLPALAVFVLARQWALAAGAVAGIVAHLLPGLAAGGVAATVEWFSVLRTLASRPQLVQGFPADVHSLQGFWRLIGVAPRLLSPVALGSAAISLAIVAWIWTRTPDFRVRWAALVIGMLLATPHLLTYDLVLLTIPLLLTLDVWLDRSDQPRYAVPLLIALYLSPLASSTLAAATGLQISTVLMAGTLVVLAGHVRAASRHAVPDPGPR